MSGIIQSLVTGPVPVLSGDCQIACQLVRPFAILCPMPMPHALAHAETLC